MSATVIIPTTGAYETYDAIESVLYQTYESDCYLVCDGQMFFETTKLIYNKFEGHKNFSKIKFICLPLNTGGNQFNGHRIYAAFPHLIDTEFLLFLDQDNWFDKDHIKKSVEFINEKQLDWCYSLRNIYSKDKIFLCRDDCESLGKWQTFLGSHLIDTNCFIIKKEVAIKIAHTWHGQGPQDRVFTKFIMRHFMKFNCTGHYSVNYRLGSTPNSVKKEFFERGNLVMQQKYGENFPWNNNHDF
jgi:hypothetical protein